MTTVDSGSGGEAGAEAAAATFSSRCQSLWNSRVPAGLFLLMWGIGVSGFLLFAVRFEFLGANFHGLPRHEKILIFWGFVFACFAAGVLWGVRCVPVYLAILPALFILDAVGIFRFGQLPLHALNVLVPGWVIGSLPWRKMDTANFRWPDYLVGCLAAMVAIASFYGLAHPSWRNSLSIAFSTFGWEGQNSEFNGLWMGHHFLAGCMVYLMARVSMVRKGSWPLHTVAVVQLIVLVVVWAGFRLVEMYTAPTDFPEMHLFPLLSKHDLAGYSVLTLGYFLGLATFPHGPLRGRLIYGALALVSLLILVLSSSKAALLVAPIVLAVGVLRIFRTRPVMVVVLLVAAGCAFGLLTLAKSHLPAPVAHALGMASNPRVLVADDSSTFRLKTWRNAVEITKHFPFTGTGLGSSTSLLPHFPVDGFLGTLNWRVYANPKLSRDFDMTHNGFHCHNDFLEVAVSMGLPGLLIFLSLYFFLLTLSFKNYLRQKAGADASGHGFCGAVFLCFLGYGMFSFFDSRIVSLAGSIFFWQFVAMGVAFTTSRHEGTHAGCWSRLVPSLAPLILFIGSCVVLGSNALPSDRTHGIWNWNRRDPNGNFLVAREAQFLVSPFEDLKGLAFSLPDSAETEEAGFSVEINGAAPMDLRVRKGGETIVALDRIPNQWMQVRVRGEIWCGRGALGLPFGMEPYSMAMRKIRGADPSNEGNGQPASE